MKRNDKYDGAASVEMAMLALKDDVQAAHLSRFFKTGKGQYGEGDKFLGIKVPVTRQVVKEMWRACTVEDVEVLLSSPWHEMRLCALLILVRLFASARKDHDLIHKAVGWLLREAGKHDAARLEAFLAARYATMPRTMLRYAIEKFPEEKRMAFLNGLI